MKPDDVRSMCCRLRLDKRELMKRGGGLFAANPLTGSVGVVTINLPRLGYEAASEENFFQRLQHLMEISKESLEIKRKVIERYTEKGLYPYSKYYVRFIRERYGCFWKNHFSTIGINGMNECCMNFLGVPISHPDGMEFAQKVMHFMREILAQFQDETGNIYNLEATPAESTSYRFALLDTAEYPDIMVANHEQFKQGAQPYYTNSTHLPVNFTVRGSRPAGQTANPVHGRNRFPRLHRRASHLCPSGKEHDPEGYCQFPVALYHALALVQHMSLTRLYRGRTFQLPEMRCLIGSLQPYRRVHASRKPMEQREKSGIRRPEII